MTSSDGITLLLYLLGAVGIDLWFRWVAFERIESIAIDISIFSVIYSFIEMLKTEPGHASWKTPTVLGIACLGGLSVLHRVLTAELKEKIEETYDALHEKMPEANKKNTITANIPVAKYAIGVALSTSWIRVGKARRRRNIIGALRKAELDPTGFLDEESFLLPKKLRGWMLVIFFFGGVVSVAIPLAYTLFFLK